MNKMRQNQKRHEANKKKAKTPELYLVPNSCAVYGDEIEIGLLKHPNHMNFAAVAHIKKSDVQRLCSLLLDAAAGSK